MKRKRGIALAMSLAMTASCISPAFTMAAFAQGPSYQNGTYTETASVLCDDSEDFEDYTNDVTVTVSDGQISEITAPAPSDMFNNLYWGMAMNGLKPAILAAQSTDGVDIVGGATCSSQAILSAVDAALVRAQASAPTPAPTPTATAAPSASTTALQDKIDEIEEENLNAADYTAESWNALQAALDAAKTLCTSETAVQSDVDNALTALTAARGALANAPQDTPVYVLMNIPYADFYKAELNNSVPVDMVSSATLVKTRTGSLSGGSYHVSSGGEDISGVIYPVLVSDASLLTGTQVLDSDHLEITVTNRGQTTTTTYDGRETLYENGDYAYYLLSETPAQYKELSVVDGQPVFGAVQGTETVLTDAQLTGFKTSSSYGDYQFAVEGLPADMEAVSAVILTTAEGNSYGLRHLENVWLKSQIALCTGFTDTVHGSTTSSAHYAAIMGQTITSVRYITQSGSYVVPANQYVPVKLAADTVQVESGAAGDGAVSVAQTLPSDFVPAYTVEGLTVTGCDGASLSYTDAKPGSYTLTVSDSGEKYAPLSVSFLLSTDELPAVYNGEKTAPGLAVADGSDADALNAYLGNVTTVSVNGTAYAATGRGAVVILTETGLLDLTTAPFAGLSGEYAITVQSTGYPELSFVFTAPASAYVLMNIPYDAFYRAELTGNDVVVDAFSSATQSKTANASLAGGTYHHSTASIDGVSYPVFVTDTDLLDGYTVVESADALFENVDYAYCILSEVPSAYKQMTAPGEFSAVVSGRTPVEDASVTLSTKSSYGDYQFSVQGLPEMTKVYGVVLNTTDGVSYGLRHLENIWRMSELALCTGFTEVVHNCPTSSAHYESIMGKTVNSLVYYTDTGVYTIATALYVPVKLAADTVQVDSGADGSGTVSVTQTLPSDFVPAYTVEGLTVTGCDGASLSYTDAKPGSYTLTVSDSGEKYAPLSASFLLSADAVPALYDAADRRLTPAQSNTDEQLRDYLAAVSGYTVNDVYYSAVGGRGTVGCVLLNENGFVDLSVSPFAAMTAGAVYSVTVSAVAYPDFTFEVVIPDTIYAYASVSYGEYWAAEPVYAAGNTETVEQLDSRSEADLGGFDAVSRATVNHGLHRGSYQQIAVLHTEAGKDFSVAYWSADGKTMVMTDGTTATWNKGELTYKSGRTQVTTKMTTYELTGIKYVPVAVSAADYAAFCDAYAVTANGAAMAGGYGEVNLSAYTAAAYVTADTNGLKTVSRSGEGFAFAARQTGSSSGLLDQTQASAAEVIATVKDASGAYGEFLRVDLTGDGYGALGAKLQTVRWTYYGADSTRTTALATYGTKFAADDWMHKSMGIQLGLSDSLRCQLPENTDGTGYWTIIVYALGMSDTAFDVLVTGQNIVSEIPITINTAALDAALARAGQLAQADYTAASWADLQAEVEESEALLEQSSLLQAQLDEQVLHVTNAIESLVSIAALNAKISEAQAKRANDYTAASWQTVTDALSAARTVAATANAAQSAVDSACSTLDRALAALVTRSFTKGTLAPLTTTSGAVMSVEEIRAILLVNLKAQLATAGATQAQLAALEQNGQLALLDILAADTTDAVTGEVVVTIPYAWLGLTQQSVAGRTLAVSHLKRDGTVEALTVQAFTETGLVVKADGLSPFGVAWMETSTEIPAPVAPAETTTGTAPATGDSTLLMFWSVLGMSGLCAFGALSCRRKKNSKAD